MVLLTGCVGTVYRTDLEVYCPPMKTYSDEYNAKLADELDALPSASTAFDTAITDYVALRDRIRACKTERENL